MADFYAPVDPRHIKMEREKARELRKTSWWKGKLQKGECHFCAGHFSPENLTMEHLVPIGRGGKSTKSNCVPSCKECNSKKGAKTSAEWVLSKQDK